MAALGVLVLWTRMVDAEGSPAWDVTVHGGRSYVSLKSLAAFYGFGDVTKSGKSFTLKRPGIELRGRRGAKQISINRLKFYLSFSVVSYRSKTLVSVFDVTHLIDPVLRPPRTEVERFLKTVVLDPSHGGEEEGVRSGKFGNEKTHTLEVARVLRKELEARGYRVVMTREGDETLSGGARAALANLVEDEAVFLSLHLNRSRDSSDSGIETFTLAPAGTPATYDPDGTKPDLNYYLGNIHELENTALATAVHGSLVASTKAHDHGIKRARFRELRAVRMPALVIRLGFLSNPEDAAKISGDEGKKLIVDAIANGVARYDGYLQQGGHERAVPPLLKLVDVNVVSPNELTEGSAEERILSVGIAAGEMAEIDPAKIDIEVYFFDVVNNEVIEPAAADPPPIEWDSVLPDWNENHVEKLTLRYRRPVFSEQETRILGDHRYFGFVVRVLYDGVIQDVWAEPRRLERCLYQFYAG